MRLFIAFGISREAKDELVKARKKLAYSRLNYARELHLTLKFLGEVKEEKIADIKEKLGKIKFSSFEAYIQNIGFFPPEGDIRVVWAGIEPKEKIIELQKKVEDSLKGLFTEDNRFLPHITLARVKTIENKKFFKDSLANIKLDKVKFRVDGFRLMKSTLLPSGPVYEILEEYKAEP